MKAEALNLCVKQTPSVRIIFFLDATEPFQVYFFSALATCKNYNKKEILTIFLATREFPCDLLP